MNINPDYEHSDDCNDCGICDDCQRYHELKESLRLPAVVGFLRAFNPESENYDEEGALIALAHHVSERLHHIDGEPFEEVTEADEHFSLEAYRLGVQHLVDFVLANTPLCGGVSTRDALITLHRYAGEMLETEFPK